MCFVQLFSIKEGTDITNKAISNDTTDVADDIGIVEERIPKLRNYISYGVGDFLGGGSFIIIGTLFLFFMTEIVGMAPFFAGLLVALGKLWDGISDPLMGYISDRTRSRFGRRRLFFLIGILPVFVFFSLLWFPVNIQNQLALFFYYLVLFIFFSTSYTILMVPYTALNAEISLNYKVRAKFSGFKQFSSGFSGAACSVAAKPIVDLFPEDQIHHGYMVMGIIFGLFFALPWIAVFFCTWEVPRKLGETEKQTFRQIMGNFFSVFKNRSFKLHIGMYIFAFAGMDLIMAMFLYYLTFYIKQPALFPYLMATIVVSQGISMPIHIKIGNVYGKGRAYLIGAILWLIGISIIFLLKPETPLPLFIVAIAILGSGMCGITVMPWVILPSVTDVDELITTEKRAGTYSGMMTLLRKIINAFAILAVGWGLTLIGFISGEDIQTSETVNSLKLFFFIGPFVVVLIGLLYSLKFRVTPYTHGLLMKEVQRLENGGSKEDSDEETRRICEMLTGIDYDNLYIPRK